MAEGIQEAMVRGRADPAYFAWYFLGEKLHDGQAEWIANAEASVNVFASGNRWGKTYCQVFRHFWRLFFKLGAEWRYMDSKTGEVDVDAYLNLRYRTMHTAQGWETASMVWDLAWTLCDRPNMKPFIVSRPRSTPPHIKFANGSRFDFRTLGEKGEGIDGTSLYLITIDEAGWVANLDWIMNHVVRIRTADVQGMVDLFGTFKPGISRDFYSIAKLASLSSGRNITLDLDEWARQRVEGASE